MGRKSAYRLIRAVIESLERRTLLSGVTFAAPVSYPVGGKPFDIESSDLTGDGRQDIVTANYNGTVSVLLNNGNGTFKPAENLSDGFGSYSDGGGKYGLVVANLGNGHPDILVANQYSNEVSILLGNGNGTFQQPTEVYVGSYSVDRIAVANLGNGEEDLVALDSQGTFHIFLGNGDGTFQPGQTIPGIADGDSTGSFSIADINGDGKPDILLGDYTSGAVNVLYGNGDGTFQAYQPLAVAGTSVETFRPTTLNGHTDLLVLNETGVLDLLLGNGNGTFAPPTQLANFASNSGGFLVRDFNGDGKLDILTASNVSGTIQGQVLFGNGNGTFQAPVAGVSLPAGTHRTIATELTGDGEADLAFTYKNSTAVGVMLNTTTGGSAKPTQLAFLRQPTNTTSGTATSTITVAIEDANDNIINTDDTNVTISVATGPSSTLGGVTTVAAVNGVATFTGVSLATVGAYTLSARDTTDSISSSVNSFQFNVSPPGQIFVANLNSGTIGEYSFSGAALNPALISGLNQPQGIDVAGSDVFVANFNSGTIGEYTTGGVTVNAALISGLNGPDGIAISGSDLFVANAGGGNIGEYTTGGAMVNAALISGLNAPDGVAVSGSDLFVTNSGGDSVGEYTTSGGMVNPTLISSGLYGPEGIAVSGADLFVANSDGGTIGEYTTSGATVNASLVSGLGLPVALAVSGSDLFVTDESNETVGEYTTSGATVNASLLSGLNGPVGIFVQSVSGPAAQLQFGALPGGAFAGSVISPPITVDVEDQFGNIVTTDNSNVTLSIESGPGSLTGNLTVAAVNGVATFTGLSLSAVGTYVLSAKDSNANLTVGTSGALPVSAPAQIYVVDNGINGSGIGTFTTGGAKINPALVSNVNGGPQGIAVAGSFVFVTSENNGGGNTGTIGEYTTSGATINASLVSGLNQPNGIAVSGTLLFVVNDGSGTIGEYTTSGATVNANLVTGLSNPTGIAISGTVLFVTSVGTGSIGAYTTSGAALNPTLVSGLPGGPNGIAVSGPDLFVLLLQNNNALATIEEFSTSGATVNSSLVTGLSDAFYLAVYGSDLFVTSDVGAGTIGEYTTSGATVNAALVTGVNSAAGIFVDPVGPATQLAFVQRPSEETVGTAIRPFVTVAVEDQNGNVVSSDNSSVSLAIASGPSGGALSGTLTEPVVNGIATFAGVSLNTAGTYTLKAADSGESLSQATSVPFVISPAGSVSFAAPVAFPDGGKSFAVASADVNGDGIPDIVTANYNGTVSVLLGNGNGTFKPAQNFSDGLGSYNNGGGDQDLVVANLGNGQPDILVVNQYSGEVGVLLGNGDGTFQPPRELYVSSTYDSVQRIAVANLGNGEPDLLAVDQYGNVHIFLGNGNGTFQQGQTIPAGVTPQHIKSIWIADINGDGKPDIILADDTSNTVVVLDGNGNGTFQSPQTFSAAGNTVYDVQVASFNGHPDLLVLNQGGALDLVLGNGNGTFSAPTQIANFGTYNVGFGAADFNGDGKLDILAGYSVDGYSKAEVFLGNGNGTFQSPQAGIAFPAGANHVIGSELTGDGKVDLAFSYYYSSAVGVMLNTTSGGSAKPSQLAFVRQPANAPTGQSTGTITVAVEDVNGSIVTSDNSNVTLSIASGPSSTLNGLVTAAAVNGVATFTGLSINTSGSYTLTATDTTDGVTSPSNSYSFNVGGTVGTIFVANTEDNEIGAYASNGAAVNSALIVGFQAPEGIAVSGSDMFLTSLSNGAISEYTTSGNLVNASLVSGLNDPYGIAVSGTLLFVVNLGTATVGEYTTSGATVNPSLIAGLTDPEGIAISGTLMFVTDVGTGKINEYTTSGAVVKASLVSGLSGPTAIALSGQSIFVANGGDISEYNTGGTLVNSSLVTGIESPTGIAVVGTNLFIANNVNGTVGTIGEYAIATGATVNESLISGIGLTGGIASAGTDLFVTQPALNTVGEYTAGGGTINPALIPPIDFPSGMALSGTMLFVANLVNGVVGEYTTSGTPINPALITGMLGMTGVAVSGQDIFVAINGSSTTNGTGFIAEYNLSGTPINTSLVNNLNSPDGIAVSGADLYVVSNGGGTAGAGVVGEYAIATGAAVNASLISGLSSPVGVAVSGGDLFLTQPAGTISEYNANTGAPLHVPLITGGSPFGIAVSGQDIYVTNSSNDSVSEYTTSGQAVNAALINTGLTLPEGIAVAPSSVGQASQLAFAPLPAAAQAGTSLNPSLTVDVEDANGNIVTSDNSVVTIAVQSGPGNLIGNLSVAAVNGVATFPGVSLSNAGLYVLNASDTAEGLATISSQSINVSAPASLGTVGLVFVANNSSGTIGEYTTGGATINASLISGLNGPNGLVVSGSDLFVANQNIGTISEYTTTGALLNPALVAGLQSPAGLAISGSDLFVANKATGTIGEYTTSGAVVNAALITGLNQPHDLTVNGANLYVSVGTNSVSEFTTSGSSVNNSLATNLSNPRGIAVSGSDIYVVNQNNGTIGEYTTGGAVVNQAIIGGLNEPVDLSISGSFLFVTNLGSGVVSEFTTSGAAVNGALISNLNSPGGIAVIGPPSQLVFGPIANGTPAGDAIAPAVTVQIEDANGNILVNDDSPVTLSITSATGGAATVTAVNGVATFSNFSIPAVGTYTLTATDTIDGLPHATSTSFTINPPQADGSAGVLFVANNTNGVIGNYTTAGSALNAALASVPFGPFGIAISGSDIFVAGGSTVSEFSISGSLINSSFITGLNEATGLAIVGSDLFVTDSGEGTIGEYTIFGEIINPGLVTGLNGPSGIAASGTNLFVTNVTGGTIGEYDTSGNVINASLVTGLSGQPYGIVASGSDLFVANYQSGTVGEYTTSGATVNPALITGLTNSRGIAVSGTYLFVANQSLGTIGEYTTTGATVNATLISGLNGPTALFAVNPPSQLAFGLLPDGGKQGNPLGAPIIVDVEDSNGNLVSSDNSNVTLSVKSGPGNLIGSLTVAAVNGVATFNNIGLTGSGNYTFAATDSNTSVAPAVSPTFPVLPATLGQRANYPLASAPEAVVVADVNGDGNLDIVAATSNGNVVILDGNGNGTFAAPITISDGLGNSNGSKAQLIVADFNGNPDIAVINGNAELSILLGNGNGTFKPAQLIPLRYPATAIADGDFNGDGKPDVVLGYSNGSVSDLLGNGNGTFQGNQPQVTFLSNGSVVHLAAADFANDSTPDLLVGFDDGNVTYLASCGSGQFGSPGGAIYTSNGTYTGFVVGDFNGDGNTDFAVGTGQGTVTVFLGNGDGTFSTGQVIQTANGASAAAVADLNDDGALDIVITNKLTSQVEFFSGYGNGTFIQFPGLYSTGTVPKAVATADFAGDGHPDVVVAYGSSGGPYGINVLMNQTPPPNGNLFRQPVAAANTGNNPQAIATGDLNGDGIPDMVIANAQDNTVEIFLGNVGGGFASPEIYTGFDDPTSVAIGDLQNNGTMDLVVGNSGNAKVAVLYGNGNGHFTAPSFYSLGATLSAGGQKISVAIGDLDDNALPEILATDSKTDSLYVLTNNLADGGSGFSSPAVYSVGSYPVSIAVGDLNGDGIPDVAVVNYGSDNVSILTSNGMGLDLVGNSFAGQNPVSAVIGQFFGNGYADLAVLNSGGFNSSIAGGASVALLQGNGTGNFYSPRTIALPGNSADSIITGDVNADGVPDLIVSTDYAGASTSLISVLIGNGDGTFKHATSYSVSGPAGALSLADINSDGKPDILDVSSSTNTVLSLDNVAQGLFFRPAPMIQVPNIPQDVASAQFTTSGNVDLAVGTYGGVEVFLGNGDGTFHESGYYSTNGHRVTAILTADINGDDKQDIVFAYYGEGYAKIGVLLGNGNGTFSGPITTQMNGDISVGPQSIAEGVIIPGDTADLAVATGFSDHVAVLRANTNGTFKIQAYYAVTASGDDGSYYAGAVALGANGALGGDGPADIAVASATPNSVFVFASNSNGTFGEATQEYAGRSPTSLALGDLNDDGGDSIVVADGEPMQNGQDSALPFYDAITVILGNSPGDFETRETIHVPGVPQLVSLVDVNGDGNLDIVASVPGNVEVPDHTLEILLGNGDGTFGPPIMESTGSYPRDFLVTDVNGDGKPDIVTTNVDSNSIGVLLADGVPTTTSGPNGMLMITGGGGDESDSIGYSGGVVTVNVGGSSETFPAGSAQHIVLSFGSGLDSLMIGSGAPPISVQGGSGNDTLMTMGSNDTIAGGTGNNSLMAGTGAQNDSISGGDGNNTIMGGGAGTTLYGGSGDNVLEPGDSGEMVVGGSGDNVLISASDGGDTLMGGSGNDTILGGGGAGDSIDGGTGLSFAQYNAQDTVSNVYVYLDPPTSLGATEQPAQLVAPATSGTGTVSIQLNGPILKILDSNSDDTVLVSKTGSNLIVSINGTAQDSFPSASVTGIKIDATGAGDVLKVDSTVSQSATIQGSGGGDSLVGGGGSNVLMGEGGNDTLVGGGGTSLLIPGQRGDFTSQAAGSDSLVGGSGYAIADFTQRTDSMFLSNDGKADSGDSGEGEKTTIATNVSAIWGGAGDDTIVGTTSGIFVNGGSGSDSITAEKASDLVVGGSAGNNQVVIDTQPVVLDLRNNQPDEYQGITTPSIDILTLDNGLDSLVTDLLS
jgi:hypothetical protein